MSFDLQLFAEEEETQEQETQETEGATEEQGATSEGEQEQQALTMEEVQKMIQSETDKVRTEYSQRLKEIEKEKEELEKEKMSEEEKKQYELEKMQKEIEEREQQAKQKELNLQAVDMLREKELPLEFREFVVGGDEESTKENIDKLQSVFQKQVEEAVKARFKENGREIEKGSKGEVSKDQFDDMTLEQKQELYIRNPEEYRRLAGK